ncbi:MAG: T9SS type A sorting domain-containing protein, partial [Bacteroidota bacterium]
FVASPAASGKISAASYENSNASSRPVLYVEYAICDQDGDGIPDFLDADADNDGIPNYLEGACAAASDALDMQPLDGNNDPVSAFNGANFRLQGIPVSMSAVTTTGVAVRDDYVIDDLHLNGNFGPRIGVDNSFGFSDRVRVNFGFAAAVQNFSIRINDIDDEDAIRVNAYLGGQLLNLSAGDITTYGACVSYQGNNEVISVCPNNLVTNSISASIDVSFPGPIDQLEILLYQQQPGDDGGSITVSGLTSLCGNARDFDNDGIPDYKDADSDGDGINDIIEAGGVDSDNNGQVDYPAVNDPSSLQDVNADGWYDPYDPAQSGTILPIFNTDGRGRPDFLDIDADDDGIIDNIEGQTTADYIPPRYADVNRNGIDDAYEPDLGGQSFLPANKDLMDLPDYRDLDTDQDGESDLIEGYDLTNDGVANTLPSGIDADGDGLDDAFDLLINTNSPFNGSNGDQLPTDFPASASNAADRAWRIFGGSSFPVEWLSFDAVWADDAAVLHWATATEINADYFEIERSWNGEEFNTIGKQSAVGNSSEVQDYTFRDAALSQQQIWKVYYRLRQVDLDGTVAYSNTVQLNISEKGQVVLNAYPSPAREQVQLSFAIAEAGEVQLEVLNHLGQVVVNQRISTKAGMQELSIEVTDWAAGLYIVKLGNEQFAGTTRFVKE